MTRVMPVIITGEDFFSMRKSGVMEVLKVVFSEHDEIVVAYLYGSAVHESLQADSDIDIGILLSDDFTPDYMYVVRIGEEIRSGCDLDREVDVRILNRRSIRFLHQVLRHGEIVFVRDEERRVEFETDVMKEYLDFKPFLREYDVSRRERLLA